jgi:small-conductance mechanosensitive channel
MSAAAQTFELVVWMRNSEEGGEVPSDLRFAIVKHFEANGISLVTG